MTEKRVKNEQWFVRDLITKIDKKSISKPKFQRKRKWDIQPKKETTPSEKYYILFLFDTKNSVHAITFGQVKFGNFSNIDGNNRINALHHFINKPFEIFPEYLQDLITFINTLPSLKKTDKNLVIDIFKQINYQDIIDIKFHKYFQQIGKPQLYSEHLKKYRDEFEEYLTPIQNKLLINDKDRFDLKCQY